MQAIHTLDARGHIGMSLSSAASGLSTHTQRPCFQSPLLQNERSQRAVRIIRSAFGPKMEHWFGRYLDTRAGCGGWPTLDNAFSLAPRKMAMHSSGTSSQANASLHCAQTAP